MTFRSVYVPSSSPESRAINWLARNAEAAFKDLETEWYEIKNTSTAVTFDDTCSIVAMMVPQPPKGYKVMVETWCNASWTSGSALDATAKLQVGSRILAEAKLYDTASAGSVCPFLVAAYAPTGDTNFRLIVDRTASRTALDVENRGMCAWYMKEG